MGFRGAAGESSGGEERTGVPPRKECRCQTGNPGSCLTNYAHPRLDVVYLTLTDFGPTGLGAHRSPGS